MRWLDKHKERLVVKGYVQKGLEYEETFFTTKKWATIRSFLSMATQNVSMPQQEGFVVKGQEHKVCKLVKSLCPETRTSTMV